jgi:hypothetical protein
MQISNKVGYLIIAIVVIGLLGYFYMYYKKKAERPPEAVPGQPTGRGESGMMGQGAGEGVLDEDGGFILYLPS